MLELEIIKPKMLEMELLGQAPSNSIIQTQEKEVTPTTNVQEITPDKDYDALSKVTVKAVTNEIDENIKPSNIKLGVSILGIEGNVEPDKPNQSKVATPTTNEQVITPDTGYELEEVIIQPVTNEIDANISSENILQGVSILGVEGILKPEKEEEVKTIEIKTNRLTSIKPTEGKTMGEVLVTTAVTPTKGDLDITENGQYDVSDYVGANVNVPIQEPKLQDKSVTITQNGTTNIVADRGYNGLNNVEVVTNVASGGEVVPSEYIQDGLIAWFDGEDDIQYEAGYWGILRSKINKSDYISVASQTFGDVTNNKMIKAKKCLVNNKTFGYRLRQNFYKQGYTIEAVGRIASNTNSNGNTGGWLITMNETGTWGVGVTNNNGNGVVTFVNNDYTADKVVTNFFNKVFGASLFLEKVSARGVAGTPDYCKASVNGSEWFNVKETKASGGTTREGHGILCYYTDTNSSSYMAEGELYCLRIYNRQLTNEEIAHNHKIDKVRFDTVD